MNSYTTVADLRRQLGTLFNSEDVVPYICQSLERIILSGLWKGMIGYAAFPSVAGFFSLPYPYLAVVGAQWFRCPIPIFGQYHDFIEGGPGQPIAGLPPEGIVEDLGDGYATASDPPQPFSTIRIQTDLTIDNNKVFRIYGISNGLEVFDVHGAGTFITTNTSSGIVFDQVTGIEPPLNVDGSSAMIGGYNVLSVPPSGPSVSIGYIYPNQVYPQFRRYRIGVTSSTNSQVPNAVTVLVRKRYIPVFKETDWVIPGNVGALKFAMQAIDNEAAKNEAQPLWDKCFQALNQELHATRGAARPEMNYEALGSGALFGNVY